MASGASAEQRLVLADGARVRVRPVVPEDRELLARGLEQLSETSRYRRFHSPLTKLSERQLDYLTVLDHHDHEALIALDEETGAAVGVARFVRLSGDLAECAVTVVDAWQGRGLGGELLDRLVERAHEEEVGRFAASVLAENQEALHLLEGLGDAVHRHGSPAVELEITLPERGRDRDLRELLRASARGVITPAVQLWRLVIAAAATPPGEPGDARADIVVVALGGEGRERSAALDAVAAVAGGDGTQVHLVAAYWPLLGDRDTAGAALRDAAARLGGGGAEVETHLRVGALAEAVLDLAADLRARLVVVAARAGDGGDDDGLDRLADRVSHHAPCNVLVVRG